ncbi:MAG TPA: hypothetical protein VKP13_08890 [Nitrospira sp.]|nr:hypothetical protein [Nitrospira sp.]
MIDASNGERKALRDGRSQRYSEGGRRREAGIRINGRERIASPLTPSR